MDGSFGALLKDWRGRRRISQLDLSLSADVSARHIAFLETGRSKPSRDMVVQLSEALMMPRADRNALLNAAGFAALYRRRDLTDAEMVHVHAAVSWMLERHDPYPALAIDRHWSIVMANQCGTALLGGIGLQVGDSLLEAITDSQFLRDAVENWSDLVRHMSVRLRTESAHLGGDAVLDAAADKLSEEVDTTHDLSDATLEAVVPTRYRAGDAVLSFFSTVAQFGSAEDIALADLKIELMFPADEVTKQTLMAGSFC